MRRKDVPLTPATQRALFRALEQMHNQAASNLLLTESLLEYVAKLDARTSGLGSVAKIVDDNEADRAAERVVSVQKELISFLYREAHTYVVVVIAAGYAAYFATFSATADRLTDGELFLSAFLMVISLSIFVLWEVLSMAYTSWLGLNSAPEKVRATPRWYKIAWPVVLFLSLATAMPAVFLAASSYLQAMPRHPILSRKQEPAPSIPLPTAAAQKNANSHRSTPTKVETPGNI